MFSLLALILMTALPDRAEARCSCLDKNKSGGAQAAPAPGGGPSYYSYVYETDEPDDEGIVGMRGTGAGKKKKKRLVAVVPAAYFHRDAARRDPSSTNMSVPEPSPAPESQEPVDENCPDEIARRAALPQQNLPLLMPNIDRPFPTPKPELIYK